MRILQLVRAMDMGGLERVVADLSAALSRNGHQVDLACLSHGGTLAAMDAYGSVWEGHLSARIKPFDAICLYRLCRHIRQRSPDVIHSHNPQALLYALLGSVLTRVPFVHTVHGRGGVQPDREARKARVRRIAVRRAHGFVAVSTDVQEKLIATDRVPAHKVRLILNGVNTTYYQRIHNSTEARLALGLPPDTFVFGSVGRLSPEKNYKLLLAAFAETARGLSDVRLLLVGGGSVRKELEAEAERLGVNNALTFAGEQMDVRPWLEAMDVFCLSSDTEGTPVALLEAAAMGLPSVITDVGGCADVIVQGEGGIVVAPGDLAQYSRAMQTFFTRRDAGSRYGQAARERVMKHFSLDRTVGTYTELYQQASERK